MADRAYRTRENLQYCKERGIRMSGPKLGRPPKDKACIVSNCWKSGWNPESAVPLDSSFGVGKRCYGMNLVMERCRKPVK
ncbi:MAG: transposase [Christensenellales bacterium]